MKSVIFICLLSLSVCFSLANQQEAASTTVSTAAQQPIDTGAKAQTEQASNTVAGSITTTTQPATTNKTSPSNQTVPQKATDNSTVIPTEKTEKDGKNETITLKPTEVTTPKAETTTVTTETTPKKNETIPGGKNDTKTTTTPKNEAIVPTETPKVQASRAFDGPSFIGGIILTLGLLAIGFMGFKYYKNQTERNYHTL